MKNIITLSFIIILSFAKTFSQVPQVFNYQSVLRDGDGNPLLNENAVINISIIQGSETGTTVFSEQHNSTTTSNGIINLQIGSINTSQFSAINWAEGFYFVQISVNGILMGVSQFLSVPYALHANTVENDQVEDADSDPTNELQDLSLNGTVLEISNGTGIDLEPIADKTVTITGADGIYVNGTYPNFTISSNEHYVGELYGGGIVMYVDETKQHGLILSVTELTDGVTWYNGEAIYTGATSFMDGKSNTDSIITAFGEGLYAAKLCADYSVTTDQVYNDWYLPSVRELHFIRINGYMLHHILENDENPDTNGFISTSTDGSYYWTSTQSPTNKAYSANLLNNTGLTDLVSQEFKVRAIRKF